MRRPLLVLVSSGTQATREFFFRSVSSRYRLWLLVGGAGRSASASWQLPYIAGHTSVDTLDPDAMLAAIDNITDGGPVEGVFCFDEARIEATARVAERLHVPTSPADAILRCRDKVATRTALAHAGVPQPASVAVRSLDEAAAVAGRIGYPVVVKPRNLAASFGIQLARTPEDLAGAYAVARGTTLPEAPEHYEDGVLIEEYVSGPEISIDAAVFGGRVVPMVIARKETGYFPYFEETGHVVDPHDPAWSDEALGDVLTRAHDAVGFTTGVTHSEFRLTADGPRVIEVNARSGGDLIPYLGELTNGIDNSLAAADIAYGREPDVRARPTDSVAAVRFYYPDRATTVGEVEFDRSLLPTEIEQCGPMVGPGTALELPPAGFSFTARLAYAIAVADSAAACRSALDAAGKALVVR